MAKRIPLISLTLALLLAAGGAYYLYLSERESYFVDRNFRLLALWSTKLTEILGEEYKHQFQYLISASSESDHEQDQCGKTQPQQEYRPVQCPENVKGECACPENARAKFQSEFKKLNQELEAELLSFSICQTFAVLRQETFVNEQPRIQTRLSSRDKGLLRLIYEGERKEAKQGCKDIIQVELSFSKLVPRFITKKDFFSDVILFDSETGKVHFQENPSLHRIDDFRDVVAQRPDPEGIFSFFSDDDEAAAVRNNKSGASPSPPLRNILQNPTHRQVTIGDGSYELFTQPVALPELTLERPAHYGQTKNVPARLILAGLVKTEQFQSGSRAIPHTWLLFFLFFVLLGLLSLPIIHLAFMDSRERLSRMHVLSLLVVCVSGTALLTLFFLDVVWFYSVRENLDDQLKVTAGHIKNTFSNELKRTLDRLVLFDNSSFLKKDLSCVTQRTKCPQQSSVDHRTCTETANRICGGDLTQNNRWVARKQYPDLFHKECQESSSYPCSYKPVFWVDRKKNVRINWTPKAHYFLEASASVAHRDYVNRILDPEPKSSLWHTKDGHPKFYAQSLRSLGTGNHSVVLSMASSHPKDKDKKWVAAIETEFPFLKAVAIPDGTGFAVIEDDSGNVLFHSDDQQSLWENFFEETDNNERLKAYVFSRTAGPFQGTYWGQGHSFYSTPLPDVPWSLVAFRNKELFRAINFEALLLAIALFAVYTGISLIVPAAMWLFNKEGLRKRAMYWLWPDSRRSYCRYAAICLIFFITGTLWLGVSITPAYAAWFVFLYPLVSLIGFWALTNDCPEPHPEKSPERLRLSYASAVLSFLLLCSALPMGVFFKAGVDREMTLAVKYNLVTLGQKLRRTPDLNFSQIQREIRGIDKWSLIAECPKNGYWGTCTLLKHGVHLSSIVKTMLYVSDGNPSLNTFSRPELASLEECASNTDSGPDRCNRTETFSLLEEFHKRIRKYSLSRLSNPVSINTLGLIGDQSPGNPFHWIASPPSFTSLAFPVSLRQSDSQNKWVILRSRPPDIWPLSAKSVSWGAAVLIIFVLMLVGVPIFIVSRMFPILRKSPVDETGYRETGNVLIIGLPESLRYYSPTSSPRSIDCIQISDWLDLWKMKRMVSSIQEGIVILAHFEYQFGVPRFDQAKLELLNALLAGGKQIRVLSTINPLTFDREDDPKSSSPDESKRPASVSSQEWSRVFQSFTLRYYGQDRQDKPDKEDKSAMPAVSRSALADGPYYEAIWQARTLDEKITLHHLARDGFVHAENQDLRYLFDLGLITCNPNVRLLHDDFEKYVLNAAQRDRLDAIERVQRQSQWQTWKWPLAIVLVVLVIGLLLTQQEFKNVVVLMLSLLPVLPSTLPELFGGLEKGGNGS